ncbi:MAG: redoxin domain-containing protein [Flavobacteriales bacterium]|nr:redoxin domain-containing protein [Flavobacteriales bacterium]
MRLHLAAVGLLVLVGWTACLAPAASVAPVADTPWATLQGEHRSLRSMLGQKATVFITMDPDCPITQLYTQAFQGIADDFAAKGVAVVGFYPGPFLQRSAAEDFSRAAGLGFPQVMDSACVLSLALQARVTPECFIVGPEGEVVYRGALDDRPVRQGRKKLLATKQYLAEALDRYLADGKEQPEVVAVGCIVECGE